MRLRVVSALLAVVSLGVVAALVITRDGTPDEEGTTAGTVATTAAPADPDTAVVGEAQRAYLAGRCDDAISLYDGLLADSEWVESSGYVEQARSERSDCVEFLAIASNGGTPADQLAAYLDFLAGRSMSPLEPLVKTRIAEVYATAGVDALTLPNCDALAGDFDILSSSDVTVAMLACVDLYQATGEHSDHAVELAADALQLTVDPALTAHAIDVVLTAPTMCEDLAGGLQVVDVDAVPEKHAALLQACMAAASAPEDVEALAALQMRYLIDLPQQPDAAAVEAALIESAGGCSLLPTMRDTDELAQREGFLVSKTLRCAQFAHYFGDTATAIELYQWFLDNAGDDPRAAEAAAGLAWNLIAEARGAGAEVWESPYRVDSVGGGITRLVMRNDSQGALDVTITGPETRFVTIPESPTSTTYSTPPDSCRLDTPSVTLDLAPGVYEVMFEQDGQPIGVGSWDLRSGAVYDICIYFVSF